MSAEQVRDRAGAESGERVPARAGRRARAAGSSLGAAALVLAVILFAGIAAEPLYDTDFRWITVGVGGLLAGLVTWAGIRWRWGALTIPALFAAFAIVVVPLAVPDTPFDDAAAILRGLIDGLAAVALGWKQLLTLDLPVGTYQAVLVPLLVTVMLSASGATALALRGGRAAPVAAVGVILPVAFGTAFGPAEVSEPLVLQGWELAAPRELAIWFAAGAAATAWVAWSAGAARRRAIRLGRASARATSRMAVRRVRGNRAARGLAGAALVVVALAAGAAFAPTVAADDRRVPRDGVDPELVVREQTSALASYRAWKRDGAYDQSLFSVSVDGAAPHRLRLAVLDRFDGVDFSVGDVADTGRFTRFPTGDRVEDPTEVQVRFDEGYRGIWMPLAPPLAAPPEFSGPRAADLTDGFYLNRSAGSGIAVPNGAGVRPGDAFTAPMSAVADASLDDTPAHTEPGIDLEAMPQLDRWLRAQALPASGPGLAQAIERLRERGYLSHSLTDGEGENDWLVPLSETYGTRFVTSPGGHSVARLETLFEQLAEQQSTAGEGATSEMLVAGIGDDEQFAAAAALVARAMGFDSRVVVGVRLDEGVPGVPACEASCAGQHIGAWVEARGADGVWAPFDVTPQVETPPRTLTEGERYPEFATVPEERDASVSDPPIGASDSETDDADREEAEDWAAWLEAARIAGLSLAAILLLALPFVFILAVKALRRASRRRARIPEVRALGAWDELVDRLSDLGQEGAVAARTETRRDLAYRLALTDGDRLVAVVDRAVFAPESVAAAEADALWDAVDHELDARKRAAGRWGRIRAACSLASFGVPRLVRRLRERWIDRRSA